MEEIITNELIRYKAGFIDAKGRIIADYAVGKVFNLNKKEDENEVIDVWYSYGYEDSLNYFSKLIDENKLDLENINTKEIMKECFTKRVLKINKEEVKEIPAGKFRM